MAIFNGTKRAETIDGTAGDDFIFGHNGNDILFGDAGNDVIEGRNGSDTLRGGAGDDTLDGGNGQDTAVYAGKRSDYHVTQRGDGSVVVRDLRPGAADGTDRLVSIERVQFADGTFKTVDIVQTNAAPIAADDALTLAEDAGPVDVTATLLANDGDADGDVFAITAVQAVSAQGATVSIGADGKVVYDAGQIFADLGAGQIATDTFTYTITDAAGLTSTATATVTITGVAGNSAPVALDDLLPLAEDAGKTNLTAFLLANDADADGDALTIVSVQGLTSKGAAVTVDANGRLLYDAGAIFSDLKAGQTATDTFTYTVADPSGATSTATATLKIQGITQAPDFYFYVQEDGEKTGMMSILQSYFEMDIESVEGPAMGGTIKFDDLAGILSFSADHDSFDRLLPDQKMESFFTVVGTLGERKQIGMVIEGVNDQIVATDDAVAVGEGAVTGNLWTSLVSNDIDPDSSAASRRIVFVDTAGTQGVLTLDTFTQTLTYSAAGIDLAPGETRTDTFTYTVTDGWGSSDTATVTVTITGGEAGGVSAARGGEGVVILGAFVPEGAGENFAELGAMTAMQPEILGADMAHIA
jgi:VCBS repeat-containing protein